MSDYEDIFGIERPLVDEDGGPLGFNRPFVGPKNEVVYRIPRRNAGVVVKRELVSKREIEKIEDELEEAKERREKLRDRFDELRDMSMEEIADEFDMDIGSGDLLDDPFGSVAAKIDRVKRRMVDADDRVSKLRDKLERLRNQPVGNIRNPSLPQIESGVESIVRSLDLPKLSRRERIQVTSDPRSIYIRVDATHLELEDIERIRNMLEDEGFVISEVSFE